MSKKRKVLLILEATLGGTGRHILDLMKGLLDRGNEVHFVYSALRADVQFTDGLARMKRDWPALRTHQIRITRAVTLSDLGSFYRLFRYLRREGPFDIIHGHSTKAGFLARLVPGTGRAARIYTPHGFMTMDPELRGMRRRAVSLLEWVLARRSAKVAVLSGDEWNCALTMGIAEKKLILIENGVDIEALSRLSADGSKLRLALGVPRDANCIGFVGRLSGQKEPIRLLEAFAAVKRIAARPTKLVIVGSGDLESAMRVRARELGIDGDILWAGPVDGAALMGAFDVLALCSRAEGFGYVLIEAMASGVPFVSTAAGVAEEIAGQGGGGLICHPWSPEQFAVLLVQVLEEPGLRHSLSDDAKRFVRRFSVHRMIDRISELYDSAGSVEGGPSVREYPALSSRGGDD